MLTKAHRMAMCITQLKLQCCWRNRRAILACLKAADAGADLHRMAALDQHGVPHINRELLVPWESSYVSIIEEEGASLDSLV